MEDKGEIKDLVDAPEYQSGQNAARHRLGDIIVTEEGYFSIQVFSQEKYENSTNNGFTGGKFHRSLFATRYNSFKNLCLPKDHSWMWMLDKAD